MVVLIIRRLVAGGGRNTPPEAELKVAARGASDPDLERQLEIELGEF